MNNILEKDPLNEREFELINIIGAKLGANQRDLSKKLEMSLGTTNLLIRRLIAKGYIRIRQLNKKKTQYILTPKGFSEKYRKSVNYTFKTIRSIGLIRRQIDAVIDNLYTKGERDFCIVGSSDLVELVEVALLSPSRKGVKVARHVHVPDNVNGSLILICREKEDAPARVAERCIDMVVELAKQEMYEA